MRHMKPLAAAVLLLTTTLTIPSPRPSAAAGPGGVIEAVKRLLAAQASADADAITRLLDARGDQLFGFDIDAGGHATEVTSDEPMAFFDVGQDGKPLAAAGVGSAARMLAGAGKRTLRTIRANCHSPECSMATCEFERTVGEGDKAATTRMRATALLRYDDKLPGFRIFHWHASPAASEAAAR